MTCNDKPRDLHNAEDVTRKTNAIIKYLMLRYVLLSIADDEDDNEEN